MPRASAPTTVRIAGVDIARGVALLGILLVNVRLFLLPLGVAVDPMVEVPGLERTLLDDVAWSLVEVLCSFKFLSLFSLLFGFGIAVQAARDVEAGRSRFPGGLRRLAVLAAIGLLHGIFIWYGDVLAMYACLGVVVVALSRLAPRGALLAAVGVASFALLLLFVGIAFRFVQEALPAPTDPAWMTAGAEAGSERQVERGLDAIVASGFDPTRAVFVTAEIAAYRDGPFLDALVFRCFTYASGLVISVFSYAWHSLAMMLAGVWAFRSGLLSEVGSPRRRRLAAWLLPTGLVLSIAAVLPTWLLEQGSAEAAAARAVLLELGALVLPMAYLVLLVEFGPGLPGALPTILSRTGRMSLTVYLSESVLATAIASWWGLGWFASMGDAALVAVALAIWTPLALAAWWWLGRFRTGPLEWVWRRLAGRR